MTVSETRDAAGAPAGRFAATARAAVVTLSGALLLRAAILGPLDALSSLVIAGGFAALLLTGTAVAGQLTTAEEA